MISKRIRVMAREVYCGISENLLKYIMFLLFMITMSYGKYWMLKTEYPTTGFFGLLFKGIIGGEPKRNLLKDINLNLPAGWVLLVIFIIYVSGDYVCEDIKKMGVIKVAVGGRKKWWNNKCIVTVVNIIIYCIIFYGCQWVTIYFINGKNVGIEKDAGIFSTGYYVFLDNSRQLVMYSIVVPVLCISAFMFLDMVISMVVNPGFSLFLLSIFTISSLYFSNPIILGNQLMMSRCDVVDKSGWSAEAAIAIDLIIISSSYLIGRSYVKYKDFI